VYTYYTKLFTKNNFSKQIAESVENRSCKILL